MRLRNLVLAVLVVLLAAGSAAAREERLDNMASVGAAMIVADGSGRNVGARATVEAGAFGVGVERYQGTEASRTRLWLGVFVPIRIARGWALEPGVGFIPIDYMPSADGAESLTVSATATIRLRAPLGGNLALVVEPLRAEGRLLRRTTTDTMTTFDDSFAVEWGSTAAVAYRF